jgi:hypothetical protein
MRDSGHYWVRGSVEEWTVARWNGEHWEVPGWYRHEWKDSDLFEVGERVVRQGRCRDCKWWSQEQREYRIPGMGRQVATDRACHRVDERDGLASVSGYEELLTEPDFGCVEFEANKT